MNCVKCGEPTTIMVQATVSAPGRMYRNFTKANIRSREFRFVGVMWETTDHICTNPKCGHVIQGFSTYFHKMQSKIKRLENRISKLKKDKK